MFDFLTPRDDHDAIVILKDDHEKVKGLFDDFEKASTVRQKTKIAAQAIMELKLHAAIEEEIFYPSVRKNIGKKIMNEADEEHHVVKLLISELEEMDGTEDHYDAKFKVLSENVRHHIREEESDMLPKSRDLDIDYTVLGEKMLARKERLMKTGVPVFAEEKVIAASKGRGDSPAQAARKNVKPKAGSKVVPAAKRSKSAKQPKLKLAKNAKPTKPAATKSRAGRK